MPKEEPNAVEVPKEEPEVVEAPEDKAEAPKAAEVPEPVAEAAKEEAKPALESQPTIAASVSDGHIEEEKPTAVIEETKQEVPAAKEDDAESTTTAATEQAESATAQSETPEKEVVTEASAALSRNFECVGKEKEQQERKEEMKSARTREMGEVNMNDLWPEAPCPDPRCFARPKDS